MRRENVPAVAADGRDTAAARLVAWWPALLAAQLVLALWAAVRALPPGVAAPAVASVAAGSQLLFLLRALPLLCLLAWPLAALRSRRAALVGVGGVWSLFLLLQAGLEQYYLEARVPLGADLFGYSAAEIRTTVAGAGGGIGAAGVLAMLVPLAVLWAVLAWRGRRAASARPAWLGGLLLAGLAAWMLPLAPGARGLGSEDAAPSPPARAPISSPTACAGGAWMPRRSRRRPPRRPILARRPRVAIRPIRSCTTKPPPTRWGRTSARPATAARRTWW